MWMRKTLGMLLGEKSEFVHVYKFMNVSVCIRVRLRRVCVYPCMYDVCMICMYDVCMMYVCMMYV